MTSRWKTIKDNLMDPGSVKPWEVLNPDTDWVSDEVRNARYSICKSCPEFLVLTTQCKQCGCVMKIKSGMEKATCPIGKW
jgi:hypothetical protein